MMIPRSLPFYRLSPGGNPTILIPNGALAGADGSMRSGVARALMDADILGAEQVGFLDMSRPVPHMTMMGGEFCVNATRSAAFLCARAGLLPPIPETDGVYAGMLTASGAEGPVRARVTLPHGEPDPSRALTGEAAIAISLPPDAPSSLVRQIAPGEFLVRLPGITHLLLDSEIHPIPAFPHAAAAEIRAERGLEDEEATGVIWHSSLPGIAGARFILPVVHVATTQSSIAETACGSGSLALALLLARAGGSRFALRQPSGHDITVSFDPPARDGGSAAWIDGAVRLTAEGTVHFPCPA